MTTTTHRLAHNVQPTLTAAAELAWIPPGSAGPGWAGHKQEHRTQEHRTGPTAAWAAERSASSWAAAQSASSWAAA
eukprot:CAMPEP_0204477298 /NCGR_PEP_ID=MMETSP0471-20130131/31503_1 /ASSEMBLY_ACC=CAM_ASM_000602 /TAXON_ID=2969 /ORGANISM="Oxyrrhis marina" /LENGTH=75 /DNA_ID=CAMNT_0051480001 /DNA_START=39 /DNA_END=263 /DNA_ORIENTATION=+